MEPNPPRACVQKSQFGWYGISFQPEQVKEVLEAFKEVTVEVQQPLPEFVLVLIDQSKYERFLELVLKHCHFSTPMYYTAGIIWGPEVVTKEETGPAAGTEGGA